MRGGWQLLRKLCERALGIDLDERTVEVEKAAQDDPGLQTEATELLEPRERVSQPVTATLAEMPPVKDEPLTRHGSFGKYEILGQVGAGGFGTVHKGRDPLLKRLVAIKTYASKDERLRQRFFREAQIAAALQHPNITTVHDLGFEQGLPFLVQEFLSGEDLSHKIARREPLNTATRIDYLLQIARGLAHAHRQGVLHRDVKPHNVRVLENGRVKILDFGIARLIEEHNPITTEGVALGTVGYLAPEQLDGGEVDQRADIFSFGVLAYELLTYERPFQGATLSQTSYRLLHENPAPISTLWPDCPVVLEAIVDRCLVKQRQDRYPELEQVITDLEALSQQLRTNSDSLETRSQLRLRRRRYVALASVTTVLLALVSSVIKWSSDSPPGSSETPGLVAAANGNEDVEAPVKLDHSSQSADGSGLDKDAEPPGSAGEVASVSVASALPKRTEPASGEPLAAPPDERESADKLPQAAEQPPQSPAAESRTTPLGDRAPVSSRERESRETPDALALETLENATLTAKSEPASTYPPNPAPRVTIEQATSDDGEALQPSGKTAVAADQETTGKAAPRLISHPQPRYPARALSRRQGAHLVIAVLVDVDGRVIRALVKSSSRPGLGFEEAASEAARQAIFHPATQNGVASRAWTQIPFVFSLEGL